MRLQSPQDVATLFPGKQKPQENKVAAAYLGDRLLVSHDSLLDECVDFNISIPARHHHPGPAKAHRDFHGLVSEILPRFGVKPRRGGGGGGGIRVKIKKEHGFFVCSAPRLSRYSFKEARTKGLSASPRRTTLFSVCFQTTCLASLSPSFALSLPIPLSLSPSLLS